MSATNQKTFQEVLTERYKGIGRFFMTEYIDENTMFAIQSVKGVGVESYPIYKYSMSKTKGFFGFFKQDVVEEECIVVAPSVSSAIIAFSKVTKGF